MITYWQVEWDIDGEKVVSRVIHKKKNAAWNEVIQDCENDDDIIHVLERVSDGQIKVHELIPDD